MATLKYITWEFYNSFSPKASITIDKFNALAPEAEARIDVFTHGRAEGATGYKQDAVKHAVCGLINAIDEVTAAAEATRGGTLASVTNDGYTETYASFAGRYSANAGSGTFSDDTLYNVAFHWLSGTGLMSAL